MKVIDRWSCCVQRKKNAAITTAEAATLLRHRSHKAGDIDVPWRPSCSRAATANVSDIITAGQQPRESCGCASGINTEDKLGRRRDSVSQMTRQHTFSDVCLFRYSGTEYRTSHTSLTLHTHTAPPQLTVPH